MSFNTSRKKEDNKEKKKKHLAGLVPMEEMEAVKGHVDIGVLQVWLLFIIYGYYS